MGFCSESAQASLKGLRRCARSAELFSDIQVPDRQGFPATDHLLVFSHGSILHEVAATRIRMLPVILVRGSGHMLAPCHAYPPHHATARDRVTQVGQTFGARPRMAIREFVEGWYDPGSQHSAPGYLSPTDSENLVYVR